MSQQLTSPKAPQFIPGASNLAGGQTPTTDQRRALYLKLFSGK